MTAAQRDYLLEERGKAVLYLRHTFENLTLPIERVSIFSESCDSTIINLISHDHVSLAMYCNIGHSLLYCTAGAEAKTIVRDFSKHENSKFKRY